MSRRPFGWVVGSFASSMLALSLSAHGAAFSNGSFETGPSVTPGTFITLNAVDTSITGWTVTSGSIDYIDTGYWQAEDGTLSLDMSGNGPGRIEQTFDTTPGHRYTVGFYLAGNTNCGSTIKDLDVGATGNPTGHYSFDVTGHSYPSMGWQFETYSFVATGASTTLYFQSQESSSCGPALDNVSLTVETPVPALSPAMGGVLALLLAVLGWMALGRRAAA